jgi:hypothetical protein
MFPAFAKNLSRLLPIFVLKFLTFIQKPAWGLQKYVSSFYDLGSILMATAVLKGTREFFLGSNSISAGQPIDLHYYAPLRETINVLLMDAAGNILLQTSKKCNAGVSSFTMDTDNLPGGKYSVSLICPTDCKSLSLEIISHNS